MTPYEQFLNSLSSAFSLFVYGLYYVAETLISNYIFITILGTILFISLVWLLFDLIYDYYNNKLDDIENQLDRYQEYCKYQDIKYKYLKEHRALVWRNYSLTYDIQNNARLDYILSHQGPYSLLKYENFKLNYEAKYKFISRNPSTVIAYKMQDYNLTNQASNYYNGG